MSDIQITPELQAVLDEQAATLTATLTAKFEADTAGLKESQQSLLAEKKAIKEKNDVAAVEAEALRLAKATSEKDVDTLTASWNQKLEGLQSENDGLRNGIKQGKINELASGFVNANVVDDPFSRQAMQSAYSKRLDIREGEVKVLDAGGNLTALSVEDLNAEIMGSSIYANHIKSGDATGGGATGSRSNGGGAANVKPNLNGTTTEKAAALGGKIEGFTALPLR